MEPFLLRDSCVYFETHPHNPAKIELVLELPDPSKYCPRGVMLITRSQINVGDLWKG
jgi:hypothetical protein